MGNFDFIAELAEVHADCARAESYVTTDPTASCIYARRAIETLVYGIYDVERLEAPYRDDLAAHLGAGPFRSLVEPRIFDKLDYIRRQGNKAAHAGRVTYKDALGVAQELFHVMVWAGLRYTTTPRQVPQHSTFDVTLAQASAPLTRDQVLQVLKEYKARHAARVKELEEDAARAAELEVQLAETRAQLAAAQAAQRVADDHDYDEAATRDRFIDLLLSEAGWNLDGPYDREYRVTGMHTPSGVGRIDYVLWGTDGLPLALVEAKRTRRSPVEGQEQASHYADCLQAQFGRRPVIFYTNGHEHWLWDDVAGYPPRRVQGFYTADELELMIQRRSTRRPLAGEPVNHEVAGRPYQEHAIRRIDEVFDAHRREALLVMATGAGKTRTAAALVQQLMDAHWVKRVLFLADRTALVRQAAKAFKEHLPSVTTVNLVDERSTDGRVYACTYPTMLNLINEVDDGARRFGPGYFDLIIIDEAHRSVYQRYRAIFEYFDALLVGLTATPKDEIDHNTYGLFHLETGVPTDAYPLESAVNDGYLVPPKGISAGTTFTRGGVRYADLSEADKDAWDALDWGEGGRPDAINAEELNRFLFNADTVDKVLGQLMTEGYKVNGSDRLGKTIIFAKNQDHADFILQRFDVNWPEYGGRFAAVITHGVSFAQGLIDKFSERDSEPHIAISVDMLDTGIDVPEVLNLVFFKTVMSKSKFWQMIGRGTRRCPDVFDPGHDKQDFLVFDYCGNLDYFSQDLPGREGAATASVTQRVVETRLDLLHALDVSQTEPAVRAGLAAQLHAFVAGMTLDNVLVRPHRRAVERFADAEAWASPTQHDIDAAKALAGLPSAANEGDDKAKRFDLLIVRRQLAQVTGDAATAERVRQAVQAIVEALLTKTNIPLVAAQAELLERVASEEWWADVPLGELEVLRLRVRGLVGLVEAARRPRFYTDFADELGEAHAVELPGTNPGVNLERFRDQARAYLRAHEDHVALRKLKGNRQLTPTDLAELERMLMDAGADPGLVRQAAERSQGLGLFVRGLVGLDRQAALDAFARFLDAGTYTASQIHFVNLIIDELTHNGVVDVGRLYDPPYSDFGNVDLMFPEAAIVDMQGLLDDIKHTAVTRAS